MEGGGPIEGAPETPPASQYEHYGIEGCIGGSQWNPIMQTAKLIFSILDGWCDSAWWIFIYYCDEDYHRANTREKPILGI